MKTTTVKGLIIKETKVGEGNKIFTVLTEEMGKIQVSAAGVRSFKSKISGACSLFCYSKFIISKGKSIFNVSSADCIYNFFDLPGETGIHLEWKQRTPLCSCRFCYGRTTGQQCFETSS